MFIPMGRGQKKPKSWTGVTTSHRPEPINFLVIPPSFACHRLSTRCQPKPKASPPKRQSWAVCFPSASGFGFHLPVNLCSLPHSQLPVHNQILASSGDCRGPGGGTQLRREASPSQTIIPTVLAQPKAKSSPSPASAVSCHHKSLSRARLPPFPY